MAIISKIGRKSLRVRLLLGGIYAALALGAVTMVYPFLLMVSGSMKSAVDLRELSLVPSFLHNDVELYRKYVEGLFNESVDAMNSAYDTDCASFRNSLPPENLPVGLIEEWLSYLRENEMPHHAVCGGFLNAGISKTIPRELREFKRHVARLYGGDIEEVNRRLDTQFAGWNSFFVVPPVFLSRVRMPDDSPLSRVLADFIARRPLLTRFHVSPTAYYKRLFLRSLYGRSIEDYNKAHGSSHESYEDIGLARRFPADRGPQEQRDWLLFVRENLNLLWIRLHAAAHGPYREFLRAKYGHINSLNHGYGASYASFEEIPMLTAPPDEGLSLTDWAAFVGGWQDPVTGKEHAAPPDMLEIDSPEFRFQDRLRSRFGNIEKLNRAFSTKYRSFDEILPPQQAAHYLEFLKNRRALRVEFMTRNYRTVLEYLVFQGRGMANTAIYCSLAVLLALLVNPMAAYAMSRYRMPSNYKILLFLMLTMAFPPMVTQIPVFLMLRRLQLLNTFAALILPGLANGYAIFLLKGFFDSLPRELYESAEMDGANEWTMFWTITMSLSKPILSVIALNAFTAAYANFMYALLICQDEKMWTLMVWLYQLQERSGQGVIYASLLIAAIPTFIVFVLCQKIIMRGIVVPVEK